MFRQPISALKFFRLVPLISLALEIVMKLVVTIELDVVPEVSDYSIFLTIFMIHGLVDGLRTLNLYS